MVVVGGRVATQVGLRVFLVEIVRVPAWVIRKQVDRRRALLKNNVAVGVEVVLRRV